LFRGFLVSLFVFRKKEAAKRHVESFQPLFSSVALQMKERIFFFFGEVCCQGFAEGGPLPFSLSPRKERKRKKEGAPTLRVRVARRPQDPVKDRGPQRVFL